MRLNDLRDRAFKMATEKGWHETERTPLEIHMLVVSEIAEATEAVRNGKPPLYSYWEGNQVEPDGHFSGNGGEGFNLEMRDDAIDVGCKIEGEAVELADAVIRIADYFGQKGWDLEEIIRLKMAYNATRPHRHGGKLL